MTTSPSRWHALIGVGAWALVGLVLSLMGGVLAWTSGPGPFGLADPARLTVTTCLEATGGAIVACAVVSRVLRRHIAMRPPLRRLALVAIFALTVLVILLAGASMFTLLQSPTDTQARELASWAQFGSIVLMFGFLLAPLAASSRSPERTDA